MGWTTPRDWTGISSDIVTSQMLNVDLRDNLNTLSTHTHTGAAGQGGTTMTGLTLSAIGILTFANQSANPDAAGELQRNGNDLLWYGSAVQNLTAADASAGTASLRTLGTTSVKAAAGNHTHGIDDVSSSVYVSGRGSVNGVAWQDVGESVTTSENTLGAAQSPTYSGDNMGRVASGFWVGGHNDDSEGFDYTLRLYIDGSLKASTTTTLAAAASTSYYYAYAINVEYVEESATSGQAVDIRIIRSAGTGGNHFTLGYGLTNNFINAQ